MSRSRTGRRLSGLGARCGSTAVGAARKRARFLLQVSGRHAMTTARRVLRNSLCFPEKNRRESGRAEAVAFVCRCLLPATTRRTPWKCHWDRRSGSVSLGESVRHGVNGRALLRYPSLTHGHGVEPAGQGSRPHKHRHEAGRRGPSDGRSRLPIDQCWWRHLFCVCVLCRYADLGRICITQLPRRCFRCEWNAFTIRTEENPSKRTISSV